MNLLFVFLKNVKEPERSKLASISPRGTMGEVWLRMNEQTSQTEFDKQQILKDTGITLAHLDKITSELLARCYHAIFGDDEVALLNYLSSRVSMNRLFYAALPRYLKIKAETADTAANIAFVKECLDMIQSNMPLAYREEKTVKELSTRYVNLHTGDAKKSAAFFIECRLLLHKMERLFAALELTDRKDEIRKDIEALEKPEHKYDSTAVIEYYKLWLYFYQAAYEHEEGLTFALKARDFVQPFADEKNAREILRIDLKINEFMYFTSRFGEAYQRYHLFVTTTDPVLMPDFYYHQTKYLQLAMITGHMDVAGAVFAKLFADYGARTAELMLVRDAVTYVKYCLLSRNYERAFQFIQLGFEKNFKATYFQYELELRNLQTAYFYLTGQQDIALETCRKHIKFLRNNGYTTTNSEYPRYFTLIKAIFDRAGRPLRAQHQKTYERFQKGSFAIYGLLLTRMMEMR